MKKLAFLVLSLVPSVALAHPGHLTGDVQHDSWTTDVQLGLAAMCLALVVALYVDGRKRVRS